MLILFTLCVATNRPGVWGAAWLRLFLQPWSSNGPHTTAAIRVLPRANYTGGCWSGQREQCGDHQNEIPACVCELFVLVMLLMVFNIMSLNPHWYMTNAREEIYQTILPKGVAICKFLGYPTNCSNLRSTNSTNTYLW